ncbi:MAG: 50S ribosomal protein L7/L12 [Clostridiales bacterium]|nr:50S ribosomal protein L7/L12 [Clostridiales bacterium]
MTENATKIIEEIKSLTLVEVSELVKSLEEEFGVSAAATVIQSSGNQEAVPEEKNEFRVVLTKVGTEKIKVIKLVREITGLGLADSKSLVDNAPKPLKELVGKDEAENIRTRFVEIGAEIELE